MNSRAIGDSVLTLSASGWTYFDTFVLYDYETESLWLPVSGTPGLTCVSGHYADQKLTGLSFSKTNWNVWKNQHPDTKYMKR